MYRLKNKNKKLEKLCTIEKTKKWKNKSYVQLKKLKN